MQENEQVRQMKEREEEKRRERLAYEITLDFRARREARRNIENGWSLNMQFVAGNQYCDVTPEGGLEEEDAQYFWQTHRVFNHIAPTVPISPPMITICFLGSLVMFDNPSPDV